MKATKLIKIIAKSIVTSKENSNNLLTFNFREGVAWYRIYEKLITACEESL